MVVPTNTTVTLAIQAQDVGPFLVDPRAGRQVLDAIPGYTNHTWFKISKPGIYRGQCAELCGRNHANLIASVRAVSTAQYRAWYALKCRSIVAANAAGAKQRDTVGNPRSEAKVATPATPTPAAPAPTAAIDAKKLFVAGKGQATACGACHTLAAADQRPGRPEPERGPQGR